MWGRELLRASAKCRLDWLVMVGCVAGGGRAGTATGDHVGVEAHDQTGPPCLPHHHPPIPAAAHAAAPAAPTSDQCHSLLADLAQLADPRQRRGRRHALVSVLGLAVCAVLAGARSLAAIGEWAADAPGLVLAALGTRRDPLTGAFRPPAEATVRRVLGRVDPRLSGVKC
jgi:hypothetical protein